MSNQSDFIRYPKSLDAVKYASRRYYNPNTGEEISRWQMQTLQAGGITPKERSIIRRSQGVMTDSYRKFKKTLGLERRYKAAQAVVQGKKMRDIKTRGAGAKDFKQLKKELIKINSHKNVNKSANGKLAKLLVRMGLRQKEWTMPVGESPDKEENESLS